MEWKTIIFLLLLFIGYHVITSVNSVIINRNKRDKLGSAISCDLNPHMDRSKADSSPIIVTTGNLKSTLLFLHSDYTLLLNKHNNSHKQTLHGPFSTRIPNWDKWR